MYGVVVMIVTLPILLVAINLGFNPFAGADPAKQPLNVLVGNLTQSSATVSFETLDEATTAFIRYGTSANNLDSVVYDERDNAGNQEFFFHVMDLSGLTPETSYFYEIVVDGDEYQNGTQPFTFNTPTRQTSPSTPNPVFGTIVGNGEEIMIYAHAVGSDGSVSTPTIQVLSDNNNYTFDKGLMKNEATGLAFNLENADILIIALNETGESGGLEFAAEGQPSAITLSSNFSQEYSPTLTSITGASANPSPTSLASQATAIPTPAVSPTSPFIDPADTGATPTPSPTFIPSSTPIPVASTIPSPTPTVTLPDTALDAKSSAIIGLGLIIMGAIVYKYHLASHQD